MKKQNIIIAGGGHAGIESALAIARLGLRSTLVTMDSAAIGRMSCNPAIGGLGKGHLVKEIDALGGIMGLAADSSGIQFKILNTSKGRAVWSPRAQVDKKAYSSFVRNAVQNNDLIDIVEDEVVDFDVSNFILKGVILRSLGHMDASALIVCSGTFMNGFIHMGHEKYSAGRLGEKASKGLTNSLINKGFSVSRLKTGTPPRLLASSIDWKKLSVCHGDTNPIPFSMLSRSEFSPNNIPCHIVHTNIHVHDILQKNLEESAMYSGNINGVGPRYCPSIEDKIVRFKDRPQHQLFLEPEWIKSNQIYVNGFSTSMSKLVQENAIRKIDGLNNAEFIRYGYAIEYDYFPTYQLKSTLETKKISGLYFAGQINGTSGYEEAAAQGLLAGANSALKQLNKEPLILKRNEAYMGVLIDDLITKEINEPYRMFTSSAEHRLFLRPENASLRLTEKGYKLGLISEKQFNIFCSYKNAYKKIKSLCKNTKMLNNNRQITLASFLKQPDNSILDKNIPNIFTDFSYDAIFSAETDIKYEGYVKIESQQVEKIKKMDNVKIPINFNYNRIKNISAESKEKLSLVAPETLGQASRIAGVRPADIGVLAIYLSS